MANVLKKTKCFLILVLAVCCVSALSVAIGAKTNVSASGDSVEITSPTSYTAADFSCDNFYYSKKALSFEYKPTGDRLSGDNDYVTFSLMSGWDRKTAMISLEIVADNVLSGIGQIETLSDGWKRVTINCCDVTLNSSDGTETIDRLNFHYVNHGFLLKNVTFTNEHPKSISAPTSYTAFDFSLDNFAFSKKALTFEYKPVGDRISGDNDYVTFSLQSGWNRKTALISLEVVANNVLSGIGKIETLDDGWKRLTINCNEVTLDGGDGTETIDRLYFHYVNHGFLLANVGFVDTYPKSISSAAGFSALDFSCANFATSGKALTFEYKPFGDRIEGDNDYVTFSLMSGGSRKTGYISLEVVADNVLSGIGRIEDVGEGWRRLTVNCSDLTLDGGDGTETINKIYFHWVNHGVMIRNADFVDEYSVDTFVDSGSVTGFSCSNFAYSDKALTFEYKPVGSRLSGASDDVTFSLMSGWDRVTAYITVDVTNNTVRSNDVYIGEVEDALNGWYKVTVNFSEMFLNNATGIETVDRMNFHWVNHGFMLANVDIVNAYRDYTEISAAYGYTASDFSIEEFATSGKALTFEYKRVEDGQSGNDVTFSLQSGWDRLTAYITVDITNNTVRSNDVYIGRVEATNDGWYRVIVNFADMPLNADGDETVNHMYFHWVDHAFLLSGVSVRPCYTVSLSGAGADSTGAGSYSVGESVTVTSGTKTNAVFSEWRINGVQVSTDPSYTFIISDDVTLTAVFIDYYTVTVKNGTGGGTYADGSEITVTASTLSGKTFREWTVNGEVVSTNSSYTFTVEEDVTIMAEYVLTLSANTRVSSGEWSKFVNVENWKTSGKLFIMDYKPSTTSGEFKIYLEDSSLGQRVASTITVSYSGSCASGFVDDIGDGWYRLTIELNNMGIRSGYNGTETISRVYLREFTSGTSVDFYGINTSDDATYYTVTLVDAGTDSTGAGSYLVGRSVTVTPGTISGKTFREWTVNGEVVSTNSSYTFTIEEDVSIKAEYEVTLSANTRISSGEWSKFVNVANWKTSGKLLTLEYKPSTSSGSFEVWLETTGNTRFASAITVQYSGSSSVGYVDDIGDGWYRLTIELNNVDLRNGYNGTETLLQVALRITTSGTSVDFYGINTSDDAEYYTVSLSAGTGSTGAGTYLAGRSVTVTPGVVLDKVFSEWQIGGVQVSTDSSYTFTPSGDVTLTAVFVDVSVYHTVTVENGTGGGSCAEDSETTVTANTPATGYYFLYWKDGDNEIVSRDASYTFTVTKDVELTAHYRAYDGTKYDGSTQLRLNTPADKAYSAVSFEFKFSTSVSEIRFKITGGGVEDTYYGDYFLGANGIAATGMTTTTLSDGYMRVSIIFASLTSHTETLPDPVKNIKFEKSGNTVYFRNVIWEESLSFSMQNGASVRTNTPNGIKFMAKIPVSLYDSDADYGMVILPYDLIEDIDGFDFDGDIIEQLDEAEVRYRIFSCTPVQRAGVGYIIQASIINIKESNLERGFFGIGFKYKNGEYSYAELSDDIEDDNVRSIAFVAGKFLSEHDVFINYSETCQDYVMGILGSADALADGKLTVNAFDSIENFRENDTVSTSATLTLSAAKGESEFGQIILTSAAALDDKTYIVLARDLVHTDGTTRLSSSAVELFNGNYVNVTSNYGSLTKGYFVDGLTPFYAAVNYEETKFDRTNGANHAVYARFNIPLNQKAGVYSGAFKVYVLGEGYKDVNVQFTVYNFTMYDTDSDDVNAQNNFASDLYIKGAGLTSMFDCSSKNYSDEYGELYDYILDYNINGGEIPYDMYYTDHIDGYIEKLVQYYNNPKVRTIRLDLAEGTVSYSYKKTSSSATKEYTVGRVIFEDNWNTSGKTVAGAKTLLKAIAEYCVENDINLFEKFFIGVRGEPSKIAEHLSVVLSYNAARNSIDYVLNDAGITWTGHDDIKNSLRTIPIIGTTTAFLQITDGYGEQVYGMKEGNKLVDDVYWKYAYYKSDSYNDAVEITINYDYVDSYSPPYHCLYGSSSTTDSFAIAILNDSVDTTHIWWYGCISPSNPWQNYAINADHVITRGNTWAMYSLGVEGEIYWAINGWLDDETTPLSEDDVWAGLSHTDGMMGDGELVLPNVERYARYADDFKFCPTYRLAVTSESIDDYNYICYAQSLIDQMASGSAKTTAQNNLNSYVNAVYNSSSVTNTITTNAATVRTARANIAALIESLVG